MTTTDETIAARPRRARKKTPDPSPPPTRTGPSMRRHRSDQEIETPSDLIVAITDRFGSFTIDLAATYDNTKAAKFFGPKLDSISQDWVNAIGDGVAWLNPPFGNIEPWAKKCAETSSLAEGLATILLLVPASVGANWFRNFVHGKAQVIALTPRVTFVGHTQAFPKDLMLCVYGARYRPLFDVWRWR